MTLAVYEICACTKYLHTYLNLGHHGICKKAIVSVNSLELIGEGQGIRQDWSFSPQHITLTFVHLFNRSAPCVHGLWLSPPAHSLQTLVFIR